MKTEKPNKTGLPFCFFFLLFKLSFVQCFLHSTYPRSAAVCCIYITLLFLNIQSAHLPLILRLETGAPVRIKPFGVEVRNVRCLRCGNYGHQSGDRECPLKDVIMPNEESRLKRDDPLTTIMAQTDSSEVRFFYFSLKYYFLSQFP